MSSKAAPFVLVTIVIATFAIAFWDPSSRDSHRQESSTLKVDGELSHPQSAEPLVPEQGEARSTIAANVSQPEQEGGDSAPPKIGEAQPKVWRLGEVLPEHLEPWKHRPRDIPPADISEFERKYAQKSIEELLEAKIVLREEIRQERRMCFQERLENQVFVAREPNMETDANGDGVPDPELGVTLDLDASMPMTLGLTGLSPSGEPVVKVVWLPWSEYPELYHKSDESTWLAAKISELKKAE